MTQAPSSTYLSDSTCFVFFAGKMASGAQRLFLRQASSIMGTQSESFKKEIMESGKFFAVVTLLTEQVYQKREENQRKRREKRREKTRFHFPTKFVSFTQLTFSETLRLSYEI